MAPKRLLDDLYASDPSKPNHKQMKTRQSFASELNENFLKNFSSALEPVLRRVVNEEVEKAVKRSFPSIPKSPSLRIQAQAQEPPATLKLSFSKKLSLPIFTGTKIRDINKNPLQILLVDTTGRENSFPHSSIKIEIVALNGDFPSGMDIETWSSTSEEFDSNVLKERNGKRPLLAGELHVVMRDGMALVGDIEFTDNSSWIRSRRFRLGARVSTQVDVRIRPAVTESFIVKDHRGETYKKHYPPALHDEVWRLEKIGKDGVFHNKLSAEGINTVQDLLKLSVVDLNKLRKILGIGMSEKMADATLKHAWTCEMGNKLYISCGSDYKIILNPVCQVVKAVINGQAYVTRDFPVPLIHKAYIDKLIKDAYANWKSLEEVDGNETASLKIGDLENQTPNQQLPLIMSYPGQSFLTDESTELTSISNSYSQLENTDWPIHCPYVICTPAESDGRYFSESPSDGDLL